MANLTIRTVNFIYKRVVTRKMAELFCCEPMRHAWQTSQDWMDGNTIVTCPFCNSPVINLRPEDREMEEQARTQ
jgi:hypothetical protein